MSNFSACRAALLAAPLLGLIAFPARADAPTVIKVDLDNTGSMQMLKLEPATVTAGKVHFQASNASVDSRARDDRGEDRADAGQVPDQCRP